MKERLLIVDDTPEICDIVCEVAEMSGYDSFRALDFPSFKEALSTFNPTIVILDLHLADTDGIELIHYLGEMHYKGSVIMCSGMEGRLITTAESIGKDKGLKVLPNIQKPIKIKELALLLEEYAAANRGPNISNESLLRGIELDQFTIHYQPQLCIKTLKVISVEALVRWQYEEGLILYPDSFIPISEENHSINTLTDWIIERVLKDIQFWQEQEIELTVSINIPGDFLTSTNIIQTLLSKISSYNIPLSSITFEITETGVITLPKVVQDSIARLRIRGLAFSIDDFGTGYSSLMSLYNIPFNELKIDKSFVMSLKDDQDAQKIVRAIINLAHNLSMSVVAEGVENVESLKILKEMDCDIAQGYLIAKAMPRDQLLLWLNDKRGKPWQNL